MRSPRIDKNVVFSSCANPVDPSDDRRDESSISDFESLNEQALGPISQTPLELCLPDPLMSRYQQSPMVTSKSSADGGCFHKLCQ